jgi:AcrR family transcriptional regulator
MPKVVDHDQYRKALLSQCFDLFAQKGYASITMRQIAETLGVSTGTLYHYFPSKESLYEQLVIELTQQDLLRASLEVEKGQTLAERIELAFEFVARNEDYFLKHLFICSDFCQQQGISNRGSNSALKQISTQARQSIAELLGLNEPALAAFVLCLVDGLIIERMYDTAAISFAEQGKLLSKMLTAYLSQQAIATG